MSTLVRSGFEFLINSTVTSSQFSAAVTGLANGRFVVTWGDSSRSPDDPSNSAVRAQLFNADGSRVGGEFLVNTIVSLDQTAPTVTALANGGFVVAWTDFSFSPDDPDPTGVRAQLFDANGQRVGAEFLVNTVVANSQNSPSITGLSDGRFVVAWTLNGSQTGGDTSLSSIRAQIFNANGTASGAEFLVNTTVTDRQEEPAITALANGRFVIAWTDVSRSPDDPSFLAIRAQMFNASGTKSGAEFLVNTTVTGFQQNATITALAGGGFVVTWVDLTGFNPLDPDGYDIRAQVFDDNGLAVGSEFLVNTTMAGDQGAPAVTSLADGRFVVVWTDDSQTGGDTSLAAIRAQVFNADGTLSGTEFLVNTTVTSLQFDPTITALADGRFVIGWTDASLSPDDPSGSALRAQIFDPRDAPVSLIGSVSAESLVGTIFADELNGAGGNDSLSGAAGDDLIVGGSGDDDLFGGNGDDQVFGGGGDDTLLGGAGADNLDGAAGADTLNGGFGVDTMTGGSGRDVYTVDVAGDVIVEAAGAAGGTDRVQSATISLDLGNYPNVENATLTGALALNLSGTAGGNALTGNAAANQVLGLDGNDRLSGAGGADTLDGGIGSDRLQGGTGQDVLTGGAQRDVFLFASAAEASVGVALDRITDFQSGVDDLDFSAFMAGGVFIGSTAFAVTGGAQVRFNPATGLLQGDTNGDGVADFTLQLDGPPGLTAADILF